MASSLSMDDKTSPQPLPPLPLSPTIEEDLSRAHAWAERDESDDMEHTPQKKDKGKEKEVVNPYVDGGASGETSDDEETGVVVEAYPPTHEDAAETRKIEENLRRWEMAERQRRKVAREVTQNTSRSLVGDVTRRASLLWPKKSQHQSRPSRNDGSGLGNHAALQSEDSVDVVPLEEIEQMSTDNTPVGSPRNTTDFSNPFDHPSDPGSPFDDSHEARPAVMNESSNPPTPSAQSEKALPPLLKDRPTLMASTSSFTRPPPTPKPLGLPTPRTPPPLDGQPERTPSPSLTPPPGEAVEPKETRWWHDFLCGCSEGSDRGGDHQAGKTNPME